MTKIPTSKTTVSYAYNVKVNGKVIGTLQGFSPSESRALERIREIQNEVADTVEIVPGRTDFTISIDRLETYDSAMLQALGLPKTATLATLTDSFDIVEEIQGPTSAQKRVISYNGCWINTKSKTIREGTITVSESVSIWVTSITVIG
jgi:hypothetical protein